jgi:uncharacterized caspase-like protein
MAFHPQMENKALLDNTVRLCSLKKVGGTPPTIEPKEILRGHSLAARALAFTPSGGRLASGGGDGTVKLWNPSTGHEELTLPGMSTDVGSVAFSSDGRLLICAGYDLSIRIWDVARRELIATLIADSDNYVIVTPNGRFDSNDLLAIRGLHWVFPDDPLRPLPPEIFARDCFEPRLLPRLLAGESLPEPDRPLAKLNRTQPEINNPAITGEGDTAVVSLRVRARGSKDTFGEGEQRRELSTDAYDLRLLRDGQLVWQYPRPDRDPNLYLTVRTEAQLKAWQDAYRIEPNRPGGWYEETVRIPLPRNRTSDAPVAFTAYCYNEDRVKSRNAAATSIVPAGLGRVTPKAYVVCLGVNASQTRELDLRFAAADARDIGEQLGVALKARGYELVPVTLVSEYEGDRYSGRVSVADATKGNLRAVLAQLAGGDVPAEALGRLPAEARHLPRSGPDDLVVLYAAGHGYTDPADGMFYLLPYDVDQHDLGGDAAAREAAFRAIFRASVSSSELSRWLRGVDAAQHVLVLDTCMSQGAVESAQSEFKPGPFGSRGLGQLAYDKAMLVLAASQTDEFAVGLGRLRHGLLTYTLLEGLGAAEGGKAPRAAGEGGLLTLSGLLRYAADQAPEVYRAAKGGQLEARGVALTPEPWAASVADGLERRWPSLGGGGGPGAQRPVLFDYRRGRPDVLLAGARP